MDSVRGYTISILSNGKPNAVGVGFDRASEPAEKCARQKIIIHADLEQLDVRIDGRSDKAECTGIAAESDIVNSSLADHPGANIHSAPTPTVNRPRVSLTEPPPAGPLTARL